LLDLHEVKEFVVVLVGGDELLDEGAETRIEVIRDRGVPDTSALQEAFDRGVLHGPVVG